MTAFDKLSPSGQAAIRERHTIVVASDGGGGVLVECAWCEIGIAEFPQSTDLEAITAAALSHYDEEVGSLYGN